MSTNQKQNILLTGRPGVGKTTVVQRVAESIDQPVQGFITQEIREKSKRRGFCIQTVNGREQILSHVRFEEPSVGKYGVDVEAMDDVACEVLETGMTSDESPLLLIDEIGKMEILSDRFCRLVKQALRMEQPVLATVPMKGPDFIESLKEREDVRVIQVTEDNRDTLPEQLVAFFRS